MQQLSPPPKPAGAGEGALSQTHRGELHGEGHLAGVVAFQRKPNREKSKEINAPISFPIHLLSSALSGSHLGQAQL